MNASIDPLTKRLRSAKSVLRESHERQFNGEDWQAVAIDLSDHLDGEEREELFNYLSSSPDPGCDCGFCKTADWID